MFHIKKALGIIEELLAEGSRASLVYAALEARLLIEVICYERLRLAHDYLPHSEVVRWQPGYVIRILANEVDDSVASTKSLYISKEPVEEGKALTLDEYEKCEYLLVGTQHGFDAGRLHRLWNALGNVALHVQIPKSSGQPIVHYGDAEKVRAKVEDALIEFKRIAAGNLLMTGLGSEVSFDCSCGTKNIRKLACLPQGKVVSCMNSECAQTYMWNEPDESFIPRIQEFTCIECGEVIRLALKCIENLKTNEMFQFACPRCAAGYGGRLGIQFLRKSSG